MPLGNSSTNAKKSNKRKNVNTKFDELTKSIAQSVTRRSALKKFGLGLFGMALACLGLTDNAEAGVGNCLPLGSQCRSAKQCCSGLCSNGQCSCHPAGSSCFLGGACCDGLHCFGGYCRSLGRFP